MAQNLPNRGANVLQPAGSVFRPDKRNAIRQLLHRIARIRHHYDLPDFRLIRLPLAALVLTACTLLGIKAGQERIPLSGAPASAKCVI